MCSINRECGYSSIWTNIGFPSPEDPVFPLLQSFQISNRNTLFKLVLPYFLMPRMGGHFGGGQRTELSLEAKQQANLVLMANIYWIFTKLGQLFRDDEVYGSGQGETDVMWPVFWTVVRTYAPYVTFPVAFVVGAVGYHLEWFIRGKDPQPVEEEKSISERREDRKLDELLGKDHTQVLSLKDKLEFAPKAVLNRNRPEKN
ncbi:hypothetical protein D623_10028867 [Myotis brandtii]|nr:hypothetical protein D623_10028867 [Myotis brandtii]